MSYTAGDLDAAIASGAWAESTGKTRDYLGFDEGDDEYPDETRAWGYLAEWLYDDYTYEWVEEGNYDKGLIQENGKAKKFPKPPTVLPGIGTVKKVESFGGEGDGDKYWIVISVTDEDGNVRLFQRNGYYASFYGSDFDGPTESVRPVDKVVTVYEAIPA